MEDAEDGVRSNLRGVNDAGLHAYFEEKISWKAGLVVYNDQGGFFKHVKGTVGLGYRKARSEQLIMDEDGTLLRDKVHISERWGCFFQSLLHKN